MSDYYFVTGTSDQALPLGKRTEWKRALERRQFANVEHLAIVLMTEVLKTDWTKDAIMQVAQELWALGQPFRIWADYDRREDLDREYYLPEVPTNRWFSHPPGSPLGDHLHGFPSSTHHDHGFGY